MKPYNPTLAEARRDLRRWSAGRAKLEAAGARPVWQRIAADKVLAELERYEEANEGMVLNTLDAWGTE